MTRPSDNNVFTVEGERLAQIHVGRLVRTIFPFSTPTLERLSPPAPDFALYLDGRAIGIEATQPDLCTLPQDRARRLEEISVESDRQFKSLNCGDCQVSLYVEPHGRSPLFEGRLALTDFVKQFADLIQSAAKLFDPAPRYMDLKIESSRVWIEADNRFRKMDASGYSAIPKPLAVAACSDDGAYGRPFFGLGGMSWTYEQKLKNRKAVVDAVKQKAQRIDQYQEALRSSELWLLVHPPRFGSLSMQAGGQEYWDADGIAEAGIGFDRIFFAEFSEIFELARISRDAQSVAAIIRV